MFGVRFSGSAFSVTFIHNSFFWKCFLPFVVHSRSRLLVWMRRYFSQVWMIITILIVSLTTIEFIFPLYLLWAKLHNSLIISANRMAGSWFLSFFWCLPCLLSISVQQIESAVDKTFCQTFEPISLIISFFLFYILFGGGWVESSFFRLWDCFCRTPTTFNNGTDTKV